MFQKGQLKSSYRLPQFFQENPQQKEKRQAQEKERVHFFLNIKKQMGLVSDPEDLVEGMSDYLKEIGIGTSFLDFNELKARGQRPPMWQLMTRALINPYSFERRVFHENLLPKIEETKLYQEAKRRHEQRMKKKQARMQILQGIAEQKKGKDGPQAGRAQSQGQAPPKSNQASQRAAQQASQAFAPNLANVTPEHKHTAQKKNESTRSNQESSVAAKSSNRKGYLPTVRFEDNQLNEEPALR